jgi:hypothetical protein
MEKPGNSEKGRNYTCWRRPARKTACRNRPSPATANPAFLSFDALADMRSGVFRQTALSAANSFPDRHFHFPTGKMRQVHLSKNRLPYFNKNQYKQ